MSLRKSPFLEMKKESDFIKHKKPVKIKKHKLMIWKFLTAKLTIMINFLRLVPSLNVPK